jgi:hypothetical protein
MITFNELCAAASESPAANDTLRQACALPRSATDMKPLPEPRAESGFDSSWEALLANVDKIGKPDA